jgi:hypothetical protein
MKSQEKRRQEEERMQAEKEQGIDYCRDLPFYLWTKKLKGETLQTYQGRMNAEFGYWRRN